MTTSASLPAAPAVPAPAWENPPSAEEVYRERCARFGGQRDFYTARWNLIANVRLGTFVLAAICLGWGIWQDISPLTWLGAVLLIVFALLVNYHNRLDRERKRYAELWAINDEAGKRLARDWESLTSRFAAQAPPDHPYAGDLDIFGRASLFQLLESMGTAIGARTLQSWLLAPSAPAVIRERQPAVAELAPLIDLRDALALSGRMMGTPPPDPEPFLAWAESAPWLARHQALVWTGRVSTVLLWVTFIAWATELIRYPFWGIFVVINIVLVRALGVRATMTLERVAAGEDSFSHYAESFALLGEAAFRAPRLQHLQSVLSAGGLAAHQQMHRLHTFARLGFPPESLLYLPVQIATLWDVQVLAALEGWQAVAGPRARSWLVALGEAEALAALSVPLHDNPMWAFPVIDPAALALEARALGHPLLASGTRVTNDVTVGPPGTFLLVTGSNMSGKSTLLRAIGANIVLAQAGGPVCATALRLPPVTLWTSMRIQDNLEHGVSYFMAELRRLKQVVDAARASHTAGDRRLFYLLDEILQGTNTAERQIAARRIILYLVGQGALGAVSTHDLTLSDVPEVAAAAQPIHFVETVHSDGAGPAMTFDYKIRPGIATSTNALRLMEIVGLHLTGEPTSPPE
jgi:hypothetical protein